MQKICIVSGRQVTINSGISHVKASKQPESWLDTAQHSMEEVLQVAAQHRTAQHSMGQHSTT